MRKIDPELHARRRSEILAAAESCFVKRGFHAASMQDIAAAAGVSMGSLYRYFANKEAIIESFAAMDSGAAVKAIDDWAASSRPAEDFAALVDGLLREALMPARAAIVAEIYAEALRNDRLRQLLARHEGIVAKAWTSAILALQRAGQLQPVADPARIADWILSLIDGYATRRLLAGKRVTKPDIEALTAQLQRLLGLG